MQEYTFIKASPSDAQEILGLYRSLVGTDGCTWSEEYPNTETIAFDLQQDALYCLRGAKGIAAVASFGAFGELNDLPWPVALRNPCELARIGVRPALQRRGLAAQLLQHGISHAKEKGFDGIRLLVGCGNPAAQRLYQANGFLRYGTIYRYGCHFDFEQLTF